MRRDRGGAAGGAELMLVMRRETVALYQVELGPCLVRCLACGEVLARWCRSVLCCVSALVTGV